ncbi:MAG: hypothetical protein P1U75_11795 [Antarcticimicrobium sp.]|uniref:hypothetical protein n=1 Tax=Antarcticimicrobium sp. TaxID=2824147 RepID=UPI0026376B68|nr:hypothetical protein [Antarcticimicrobium sp.]MDF1717336.1 hypothetical protein [Antarcticimicrobium sp.]
MAIKVTHDLHKRRFGRNLGVGLLLAGFVAIVFGLTIAKVTSGDFQMKPATSSAGQN